MQLSYIMYLIFGNQVKNIISVSAKKYETLLVLFQSKLLYLVYLQNEGIFMASFQSK